MELHYTGLLQSGFTHARSNLTMAEYIVLMFIYQRTIRFNGKRSESIPLRHFLEGVYDREGNPIVGPASCDKATVLKAIKGLITKGLIAVRKTKAANIYTLLMENIEAFTNMAAGKLKLSRKQRLAEKEGVVGNPTNEVVGNPTNRSKRKKVIEFKLSDFPSGQTASEDLGVVETLNKSKTKNEAAVAKKGNSPTNANVTRFFASAMKRFYPDAPRPAGFSRMGWNKMRSGLAARPPEESLPVFIGWVVEHWATLKGHDLSWAKNMRDIPDADTLASLYQHILKAKATGEVTKRLNREKFSGTAQESTQARHRAVEAEAEASRLQARLDAAERDRAHYKRIAQEKASRAAEPKPKTRPVPTELADELGEWEEHQ